MQTSSIPARSINADEAKAPLTLPAIAAEPRTLFLFLTALFATHVVVRLLIVPIPELDESWQVVLSQHWAWGYYGHPPLYTWLQIVFFGLFGESLFTLALLKNALLFALYALTYIAGRAATGRHDRAALATLCLLLIPQVSWEAQRDLTHSVLLSTMTVATLWAFLRLAEAPGTSRYVLFGTCAGLTLLSKYNGGLFLAGALFGALMVPRYRAVLSDRRVLLAAVACLAVTGPHLLWVAHHSAEALAATSKLDAHQTASWTVVAAKLPWKLARAFCPNLVPLAILYVMATATSRFRDRPLHLKTEPARLIFWASAMSLLLLAAGLLAWKAVGLRGRWFMPVYVCAPILLVTQIEALPRSLYRLIATLAVGGGVAVLILLPFNVAKGGGSKNQDLTALTVADVKQGAGDVLRSADLIVADDFWIAGTMRLAFHKPVVTPHAPEARAKHARRIVAVFECKRGTEPGEEFRRFLRSYFQTKRSLRLTYLSPGDNPRRYGMRVGVAFVE